MNSRARGEETGKQGTEEALLGDVLGGLEDAHIARDGFRRDEIVAGDHEDADAGLLAQRDAVADFDSRRIFDAHDAEEAEILLDGFKSADIQQFSADGGEKRGCTCVRDGADRCRKPSRRARACRPWPSSEAPSRTWNSRWTRNDDEARALREGSFRSME